MIDHPNPLRILPMSVLVIFLFKDEMWQQVYSQETTHQWVRINQFLNSTTIEVGSDLKIPCSVEGYPIPTVNWYKDGQIIWNNEWRQVVDNQLVFLNTNILDSGSYTCFAYNSFSSDSQTVMITIKDIPVKHDEDENINVKAILWIALVQLIFLLLVCCLIHLLINQKRKDEKLKELMNLNPTLIHRTKTI